jgi:hypothetical protein
VVGFGNGAEKEGLELPASDPGVWMPSLVFEAAGTSLAATVLQHWNNPTSSGIECLSIRHGVTNSSCDVALVAYW